MARHDCNVPNTTARVWKCPRCGRNWTFDPDAGFLSTLWHGRDNVRNADGTRLGFWQ